MTVRWIVLGYRPIGELEARNHPEALGRARRLYPGERDLDVRSVASLEVELSEKAATLREAIEQAVSRARRAR